MTKLSRRGFLQLAAGAPAFSVLARSARAQTYPSRPVRWIVGFAPGGGNDLVARLLGQRLSERLGQAFVVENRPGAAGNLAADAVVHARPDGYTLLLVSSNNATNAAVFDNLGFDFVRDIAPVAGIGRTPLVMAVNPSVPAKTVPEFIAYAKSNPGKVNMGSAGTGGIGHLAGEEFKMMAGIDMTHVPYRGNGPR
jgi:tripartite-type tricarboxylate transporter receptor subunit TctC